VPRLYIDFDPHLDGPPGVSTDTSELVWFLSWAFAGVRYGGSHEMSQAALTLRKEHGIDLTPLLTFADREVEEPEDAEELERVWQDAGPLAACCDAVLTAFRTDPMLASSLDEYTTLLPSLEDLAANARWAADRGVRIRITYSMEGDA
jgi:hypothetical protein